MLSKLKEDLAKLSAVINEYELKHEVPVIVQTIFVYSDGTTESHYVEDVVYQDEVQRRERVGNANYHNGKYYKSVDAAFKATGVHRYWINKYCNKEILGWRWAK